MGTIKLGNKVASADAVVVVDEIVVELTQA
jgi:hypothetical protein